MAPKRLLDKGCRVVGTFRRTSLVNFLRIEGLGSQDHPNLQLVMALSPRPEARRQRGTIVPAQSTVKLENWLLRHNRQV